MSAQQRSLLKAAEDHRTLAARADKAAEQQVAMATEARALLDALPRDCMEAHLVTIDLRKAEEREVTFRALSEREMSRARYYEELAERATPTSSGLTD